MALFVGLDVSLKTTSICVVESDGSPVWEGQAESEPIALIKVPIGWRERITLVGIEAALYQNGSTAHWSRVVLRPFA